MNEWMMGFLFPYQDSVDGLHREWLGGYFDGETSPQMSMAVSLSLSEFPPLTLEFLQSLA